jgi:ABC-type transport system substrate-binding protein
LAAVAVGGDEPSFSTGRVTTRVDNNPDTVVYKAIDDVTCSGSQVTVLFSRPVAEWRMLFAHLLPAHAIAAVAGVDDVEDALRSRDLDGLRPLSDVWDNGFGEGADPRLLVSAGPFVVTDVLKSGEVRLQRNERYGGTPAVLDGLVMRPFTDPSGLPSALGRGDVQVAEIGPNLDILGKLQDAPAFEVVPMLRPGYVELGFVQGTFGGDPNTDDPAVRRALALCVDRDAILDELVHPFVPDAPRADSHLVAPTEPGYRPEPGRFATRDVSAARAELEAAGWVPGPDGVYVKNDVRLSLVMYHSSAARPARIAELVRDSCAEAGIEVALDLDPGASSLDHGSVRTQTWGPFNSVESNVSRFDVDGLLNNSGYSNPDIVPLLDAVRAAGGDPEALAAATEAADAALWEDAASIPLYPGVYLTTWDTRLCGVVPNPTALGVTWNAGTWRQCDPPPAGGGGGADEGEPVPQP